MIDDSETLISSYGYFYELHSEMPLRRTLKYIKSKNKYRVGARFYNPEDFIRMIKDLEKICINKVLL